MHRTYILKTLQILTYDFDWLYFTQCVTSLSSINHLLCRYAKFLLLVHIDEVLSINPSATVFVFGDFNVHHKDILVELIDLGNSVIVFLSQTTFLR